MRATQEQAAQSFDDILKRLPDSIRSIALELRRVIRAALPEADEGIHGGAKIGMALYSLAGPNNVVCGIQPTASACNLFFHGWASLVEHGYRLEGTGKNARHIKLRTLRDVDAADVVRMLAIARDAIGR